MTMLPKLNLIINETILLILVNDNYATYCATYDYKSPHILLFSLTIL